MARVLYEDMMDSEGRMSVGESTLKDVNSISVAANDEWNTVMEDFADDIDDYQDLNFPDMDDDY